MRIDIYRFVYTKLHTCDAQEGVSCMSRSNSMIIRLNDEELKQISNVSKELGINKSELVRVAIANFIKTDFHIYIKDASVSKALSELCDACSLIMDVDDRNLVLKKLGDLECLI